ncbi:TBC1 domain family member 7 [Anthonomus grandis grandis]|uniref:TBC1 domain family member 7 n=1 Tax=Anthonomus grandis grandis TaxID=2921223 RepID=UPI0021663E07|nr:TBC1 domain family member 7 [Anthonomus grandis grandis]
MSAEERNFRSIYYEKVGFKSVEEKKSLEMLLKERPLDLTKLRQFCLRFTVPHAYRSYVWKLLLDVVPRLVHIHDFIMSQRKQEFDDLYRTLGVLRIPPDEKAPKSEKFMAMWLILTGNLTFNFNIGRNEHGLGFLAIVKCLLHYFDDDVDIFWIARRLCENIMELKRDFPKLIDATHHLLEKENPQFYKILMQNGLLEKLPLDQWFDCCFAGVLNENCIIKIWDKICGGSYKILAYLATVTLTTLSHKIVNLSDANSITQCIQNIPEETADIIVNKTIDMWQHHGSPLTVHDRPKAI